MKFENTDLSELQLSVDKKLNLVHPVEHYTVPTSANRDFRVMTTTAVSKRNQITSSNMLKLMRRETSEMESPVSPVRLDMTVNTFESKEEEEEENKVSSLIGPITPQVKDLQ